MYTYKHEDIEFTSHIRSFTDVKEKGRFEQIQRARGSQIIMHLRFTSMWGKPQLPTEENDTKGPFAEVEPNQLEKMCVKKR